MRAVVCPEANALLWAQEVTSFRAQQQRFQQKRPSLTRLLWIGSQLNKIQVCIQDLRPHSRLDHHDRSLIHVLIFVFILAFTWESRWISSESLFAEVLVTSDGRLVHKVRCSRLYLSPYDRLASSFLQTPEDFSCWAASSNRWLSFHNLKVLPPLNRTRLYCI